MDKLIRHMQADTAEEDARRQAARDAKLRALMDQWKEEGNLPGMVKGEE